MRDYQAHLLKRASLWMLGQALPDAHALRGPARVALTSVVVAAAAGTLVALGVVAALIGLYLYLVSAGVAPGASLALVGLLGALSGLVVYGIARRVAGNIPEQFDELKLFQPRHEDLLGDLFNLVVGGFLEGVTQSPKKAAEKATDEIHDTLAKLLDRLAKLEAEAEQSVEEAEEVVLDIERHAPRRRKP